ncbi:MAG: FAD:protein FMN transferase [Paracoccaceae bacterium]
MNRRRFLCLTAAVLAPASALMPSPAPAATWAGRGLGAALGVTLHGADPGRAALTFARVEREIDRIETLFSLYRDSALTRLNRDGRLAWPSNDMLGILDLAARVHRATGGAFDPSVQPLWQAMATGGDREAARALIGLDRLRLTPQEIALGRGQALTLNGIAQGWTADRIAALLRAEGYGAALIDMGELAAIGAPPQQVAIAGPQGRWLADTQLADRALATSSPGGTLLAGQPHILGPSGQPPLWQTVAVSAPSAALADALSTAFCLMPRPAIARALAAFPGARIEVMA